MALNLSQIDKVFDPALILPIPVDGQAKEYRVEDVPALLGLYCQRVWAAGLDVARIKLGRGDGDEERARSTLDDLSKLPLPPGYPKGTPLHIAVLGDTYQQMLDDGVTGHWIQHAGMTVVAWLAAGDDVAAEYWASAGRPERMAPNRAARRRRGGASTSTGAANGTPSRASTSGTTSRRKGSRGRGSRSGGTTS